MLALKIFILLAIFLGFIAFMTIACVLIVLLIEKRIKNGLNIEFNNLKLNPVYEECKKEINDVKMKMQKIEALEKDPEYFIFELIVPLSRLQPI